jgi:hypothetical protein
MLAFLQGQAYQPPAAPQPEHLGGRLDIRV